MRYSIHHKTLAIILLMVACFFSACSSKRKVLSASSHSKGATRSSVKKGDLLTDVSGAPAYVSSSGNMMADYAQLLGVKEKDLKNTRLYGLITDWMGTPYSYGGTSKQGVDCSGFATIVMEEVYGKKLPRSSEDQSEMVKRKYEKQLREGDLVFFSFGGSKINHVGVYLQNGKFVHASTTKGVIISNLKDNWYYRFFKRAGTVR